MEMKQMMEKLGAPQTHIGLKGMIKEVDEDNDDRVSFREVSYSVCTIYIYIYIYIIIIE
jgi:Ca2+-binding EF-hand superfamily protein